MLRTYFICKQRDHGFRSIYLYEINQIGGCVTIGDMRYAKKYESAGEAQADIERIANRTYPWQVIKCQDADYGIKKVLNDGHNLRDDPRVRTFLTNHGYRTPKYIWVGYSEAGCELVEITRKNLLTVIERDNKYFGKGGKYYNETQNH